MCRGATRLFARPSALMEEPGRFRREIKRLAKPGWFRYNSSTMKNGIYLAPGSRARAGLLALLMTAALRTAVGADPGGETAGFPGTRAPKPAVWVFGPVEGNVQPFRVTLTGFGQSSSLPEGLVLSIPGQAASRLPGTPDLPFVSVLIRGLANQTARVEVNPPQWVVIPGVRLAPSESPALDETTGEASETRQVRLPSAAVYGADAFWPGELARVEEVWIGTEKKLRLECAMMHVNPVAQILRYTLVLEGRLVFEQAEKTGTP